MKRHFILGSTLIAVLALTGCTKKTEEAQPSSMPDQAVQQETVESADVQEGTVVDTGKIKDLFAGFLDADYRAVIVMEGGTEQEMGDMTMEYDAPEKIHMTVKSTEGTSESIILPEAMYTRQNDGVWMKILVNPADETEEDQMGFTQEDLDEFAMEQNIIYEGKESCSVGMCDVYSVKNDEGKTTMYIDAKKKRPVKMVILTPDGHKTTMTYEYTQITVTAPTENVKEMPLPGADGQMSEEDLAEMMKAFQ